MTDYCTTAELKGYLGHISDVVDDTQFADCITTASRAVDHYCGRRFFADNSATARVFTPTNWEICVTDDFQSTSGLIVAIDSADTGSFATTLDSSRYELEPFNGVVDGEPGWPFYQIRSLFCEFLPWNFRKGSVQVTAMWGWAAVPAPVKQAAIYLASETFKLKGAPFGVANTDQFGPIRVRDNPKIMAMLAPYRRDAIMVG